MAIFGKKEKKVEPKAKKTTEKKAEKVVKATKTKKPIKTTSAKNIKTTSADLSWVLVKPRITERSSIQSEKKVYVFEVSPRANKKQIAEAITMKFGVLPVRVNVAQIPSKAVFRRGRKGVKSGGKKAYVYLSQADSIDFV